MQQSLWLCRLPALQCRLISGTASVSSLQKLHKQATRLHFSSGCQGRCSSNTAASDFIEGVAGRQPVLAAYSRP